MQKQRTVRYENNPFMIGLEGLKLVFGRAKSVAIFAIVLSVIGILTQFVQIGVDLSNGTYFKSEQQVALEEKRNRAEFVRFFEGLSTQDFVLIGVAGATALFLLILIGLTINGIFDHTAARLRDDKDTTLKEAFKDAISHLASYLWLNIIIVTKIFLWSLLFIIPGFIMAVRYSLSGAAFFNEDLRGNTAIKRSLALTKGAWLTTFAGYGLWNLMTLGMIEAILKPGSIAVLYRQLASVTDANQEKPAAHWLSWLTLLVPIAFVFFIIMIAILIVALFAASMAT